MLSTGNLGQIRAVIIDSLMARIGKQIDPALINETTTEIMEQINLLPTKSKEDLLDEAVTELMSDLKGN